MNQRNGVTLEFSSPSAEHHKTKMTDNPLASVNTHGAKPDRFHSADSLRAGMMFLGIVLHGALPYSSLAGWPIRDSGAHPAFYRALIISIHTFRMPLFFLLAGFFANLLYKRLGPHDFLKNRTRRILLPFIFGLLILYPPTVAGVQYALNVRSPHPWESVAHFFTSGRFLSQLYTMHLWFLYYLFFYYLFTVGAGMFSQRLGLASVRNRTQEIFRGAAESKWCALIFAIPTLSMLYLSPTGSFGAPSGWLPVPIDSVIYGYFYMFGWYLLAANDLLMRFERYAWANLTVAIALSAVEFSTRNANDPPQLHVLSAAASAIICWCMIFSLLGLGNRYLNRGSRRVRYAADSSYWVYLVHYPIVLWLQVALTFVHLPALMKLLLVVSITSALSLGSYALFVRYTFVGRFLNGVRHRPKAVVVANPASIRS